MPDSATPTFLVDASSDPIVIRVEGRASFQNSASVTDFVAQQIKQGKLRYAIDFKNCLSMDSTFLGTLAGAALQLKRHAPPGSLVLVRLSPRNLDLVRNLGLHRLCHVDGGDAPLLAAGAAPVTPLKNDPKSEIESARLVLAAHEALVATDEANREKFQDVLTFLRKRLDQG